MDTLAEALLRAHPERASAQPTNTPEVPNVPEPEPEIVEAAPEPVVFLPVKPVVDQFRAVIVGCGLVEPRMTLIMQEVCKYYGAEPREIVSPRRTAALCLQRQILMYLCRELTSQSMPQIGRFLADRDHTTILHGCRKIANLVQQEGRVADDVAVLKLRIADIVSGAAA